MRLQYRKQTIWTLMKSDGYVDKHGVEVVHYEHGITRINSTQHITEDLVITDDKIQSKNGGWYLVR